MNAKEISDATLPAVTPADNDLMILYDVSEGTTGKAPISAIAPKVAENIDIATNINNVIKRGLVTIPASTVGVPNIGKSVTFDTPFDDDNYVIELTRSAYNYYADTSIIYLEKTKYGFSIDEFNINSQVSRPAHEVSWVAIKV